MNYAYLLIIIMNIPTEIDPETLPDHDPDRFTNFFEIELNGKPAFRLLDGTEFILDSNDGYVNLILS